ncbi:MAG: phasin family protein [Rubrivivax sp.]
MVKKLKSLSEKKNGPGAGLLDSELAGSVKDSAQQIWLAGMGAFAKAQAEGGKVFESLVKEGMSLQKKTQGMAEEKIGEVTGRMSAMAGSVTAKAGQNWDRLESIFEQRTAKAMAKLGVPTAKDVDALVQRVDALTAAVERLGGASLPKAAARRRMATKAAAKPARNTGSKRAVVKPATPAAKRAARKSKTA